MAADQVLSKILFSEDFLRSHLPRLTNPKILFSHNKFDMIFQEVVNMHLTYETMKLLYLSVNWVVHVIVQ